MTNYIQNLLSLIDNDLKELDLDHQPPELYQPIRYILSLGGKRLRPLLVLLSYNIFKGDPVSIVRIASLVEIFHNFTLMHDDIMDEAPLRRGKPTVHEKWNTNIGILSGDIMMVKAYEVLEQVPQEVLLHCLTTFNRCAGEVCEGQQVDMNFESLNKVSASEYLEMIRQKTAVLLGFCMELGAILAKASPQQQALVRQFGVNIGMGFQLKDDLLDVYGDQAKFGKQVGGDIIANKKTYLLIKALEQAPDNALQLWMNKKDFDKQEKVQAVTAIYDSLDIRTQTEEIIKQYFGTAYQALDQLQGNPQGVSELRFYADYLTNRDR